jgi:glycosyltransferase involved in cell wall biosynthesis
MADSVFIGELPPPYGGVAVKDKLVYETVFKELGIEMIDLVECKRTPLKVPYILFKVIAGMTRGRKVIIGVGTPRRRKILLQMQKYLGGKKGLKKVLMLGMGGRMHQLDSKDLRMRKLMCQIGSIWVETNGMISEMQRLGISNVYLFPNCRTDIGSMPPRECNHEILKLVFFSRICQEKGVDIIIDAIDRLPSCCTIDFYGEIASNYKDVFEKFLQTHPTIVYHGVFDATNGEVYRELNKYDVMLLPSLWVGEGVPGALVESKMAGITAIVSDWNFNKEIVVDGVEGIVLKTCDSDALIKAVNRLYMNRAMVMDMKQNAFESRSRYDIETYKDNLQKAVIES